MYTHTNYKRNRTLFIDMRDLNFCYSKNKFNIANEREKERAKAFQIFVIQKL